LSIGLFVTKWHHKIPSLWQITYPWIPAGAAIRVVARVVLLLLIPGAVALASFLQQRRRLVVALLVVGLCALEQARQIWGFSKSRHRQDVAEVVRHVTPGHQAFFYAPLPSQGTHLVSWKPQIDAMWAQLDVGIPTLNGYSGKVPPEWLPLFDVNREVRENLDEGLASWLQRNHLPEDAVCIIRAPVTEPPVLVETVTLRSVRERR